MLCSQRGEYINGECHCNPGWKGKECSLRHDECEVADCNGHGHCVSGKCQCVRGYKGKFCEEGELTGQGLLFTLVKKPGVNILGSQTLFVCVNYFYQSNIHNWSVDVVAYY